jgi:hypothetical protein
MSIKLRGRNEFEDLQCGQAGTMSATTIAVFVAPFALQLKGVIARAGTAGTTGTSNTDVRVNGTSIFASGAAAIQFASGSTTPTYGAMGATNPSKLNKGDVVTIVNTAIHGGTAIQNLAIAIAFQRQNSGVSAMLFDTLGKENE